MGARYLKTEDDAIRSHYPTASRAEILELIPNRTWSQIGARARNKGIHRTSKAWGNSIQEGRKLLSNAWTKEEEKKLIAIYPHATYKLLLATFPSRTFNALSMRAQHLGLHRTHEARCMQVSIGRRNARKEKEGSSENAGKR